MDCGLGHRNTPTDARYMLGLEPFAAIGLPLSPSVDALILGGRTHLVSKCLVRVGQLHSTRKHPARSGVEHSEAMLAQQLEFLRQFEQAPQTARQTHVARRAGQLSKATQAHIEALEKSIFTVPGHLSAFDLFPNFDKILHAVVDPMHALLEGILPFYVRKVLVLGRYCALPPTGWAADEDAVSLCSTDSEGEAIVDGDGLREVYDQMVEQSGSSEDPRAIERLQRYAARVLPRSKTDGKPILAQALLYRLESMMEEVIYPPYINRIGKKFFTKLSFFSDLEPLGGDDGESGFRKKVLPQSSDGLGSILEIRHLKAKWTGALTLLHSSQNNGANRVPLPCTQGKADEALEPEAREKLYLPANMLKHRLQNHLLEHRMRDHFGKNDQGKVECPCCTKEYHSLAALCGHIVRQHPNSGGKEIPQEIFRAVWERCLGSFKDSKAAVNVPFHQLTFRHWLDCHQLLADRQRYGDDQDDRLLSLKGRLRQRELLGYLTVEGANELQVVADEYSYKLWG
ncbi:hypothetical protein J010_02637 [Cryptococcus neoformans]|nr:hypothetical protein C355_02572 [Cryptococcus neoformans var. grubii Th84]OXH12513.1 hypothetical protein J010_02637 [Cryptococcus neoformans var. grubii]OXH33216.1 hypothetical protein J009_02657 [Cryptococcus neoformans var. grubii]OXH53680.1 hypothetical protein J004_02758 [Cryptococcus neoformans var. grubii]OXH53752.1 hypothetical protein J003_02639 [Cryptococcus neoformans var. grubii]